MEVSEAKRLRELEDENVADLSLVGGVLVGAVEDAIINQTYVLAP
jgi:hypothetical protein